MSRANRSSSKSCTGSKSGSVTEGTSKSSEADASQSSTPLSAVGGSASGTALSAVVAMETTDKPLVGGDGSHGLDKNLDCSSGKPDNSKNISGVQEGQPGQEGHDPAAGE